MNVAFPSGCFRPGLRLLCVGALLLGFVAAPSFLHAGVVFGLPTANQAIYEPAGGERYFVGTVGKPWQTGTFGCVRSDGWKIHEGLDVRCLQRDRRGEPLDPVLAAAPGTVVYINSHSGLSNYGNYIVLRHLIEGLEVYSLYAHLHHAREGLHLGMSVQAGEVIATMGRTTNTREGISRDRAHVHFELDLLTNDRYAEWHRKNLADQRNDHGDWNGFNLNGLDPRRVLLEQHRLGAQFSLVNCIRSSPELCRVQVRATNFPYLRRCPALVRRNPLAERDGVAGYEIALDFNAVAFDLIPRSAAELRGTGKFTLLSVNEVEQSRNPARRLVTKKGASWELTKHGLDALDLLTF